MGLVLRAQAVVLLVIAVLQFLPLWSFAAPPAVDSICLDLDVVVADCSSTDDADPCRIDPTNLIGASGPLEGQHLKLPSREAGYVLLTRAGMETGDTTTCITGETDDPANQRIKLDSGSEHIRVSNTAERSTLLLKGLSIISKPSSNDGGILAQRVSGFTLILDNVVYQGNPRPVALFEVDGGELSISDCVFMDNTNVGANADLNRNGSAVYVSNINFDTCQLCEKTTVRMWGSNR